MVAAEKLGWVDRRCVDRDSPRTDRGVWLSSHGRRDALVNRDRIWNDIGFRCHAATLGAALSTKFTTGPQARTTLMAVTHAAAGGSNVDPAAWPARVTERRNALTATPPASAAATISAYGLI